MEWDNYEILRNRETLLANGGRLQLFDAFTHYSCLQNLRVVDDLEWDAVYLLREVALGRPIENGPRDALIQKKLLDSDGEIDPEFRDIILSSVQGEDRLLHLISPFTNSLDRALVESAISRQLILAALGHGPDELDPESSRRFLIPSKFEQAEDLVRGRAEELGPYSEDGTNKELIHEVEKRRRHFEELGIRDGGNNTIGDMLREAEDMIRRGGPELKKFNDFLDGKQDVVLPPGTTDAKTFVQKLIDEAKRQGIIPPDRHAGDSQPETNNSPPQLPNSPQK